jgi:hypothetical protein
MAGIFRKEGGWRRFVCIGLFAGLFIHFPLAKVVHRAWQSPFKPLHTRQSLLNRPPVCAGPNFRVRLVIAVPMSRGSGRIQVIRSLDQVEVAVSE